MEMYNNCQSCGMPIDQPGTRGTEKDGSESAKYCKYCYQQGEFVKPDMTLEDMRKHIGQEMRELHLSEDIITKTINYLPYLERWIDEAPFIA